MSGVLFCDLARHTGVAFDGPVRGVPATRLITLPKTGGDKEGGWEYGPLFAAFRQALVDLIALVHPDVLGFEAAINVMGENSPAHRFATSQSTIRILYGLVTITEEVAETLHLRVYECHIASIKKFITGSGRAEKSDVIRAVQRLGWDVGKPADDNRADAAAGWAYLSALTNRTFAPKSTPLFAGART